ncbi:MAG TPA: flagellin, partial [Clostridiales bacterium]|nr:flagellin [Clostridiales bacterium]
MRINNNMMAMNTHRQLGVANSGSAKSMEKLSSGSRINRAGDDAAGLSISEKMRAQIRGLNQASKNSQDGISMIQTAEGALQESQAILQRMRELSVQASNGTLQPEDQTAINTEISQLTEEIDRISTDTKFNGKTLLGGSLGVTRSGGTLDGTIAGLDNVSSIDVTGGKANATYTVAEAAGTISLTDADGNSQTIDKTNVVAGGTLNFDSLGVKIKTDENYNAGGTAFDGLTVTTGNSEGATFQIGADAGQSMAISIGDMSSTGLGIDSLDVSDHDNANLAITSIDDAITKVSTQRANLGAWQNRLEHTIKNLDNSAENLQAAES